MDTKAGAPSDPIVLDDDSQNDNADHVAETNDDPDRLVAKRCDGVDQAAAVISEVNHDNDEPSFPASALSDDICFICGSDLKNISTGLKGRLNHLKRCSKKHGVSARDVKLNDDAEYFVETPLDVNGSSPNPNNPYARRDDSWHEGASTDLALAADLKSNATEEATKPAAKQTTMKDFFEVPVRSLNNVLLAGARRMAKSAELLSSRKKPADAKAPGGFQKKRRTDFSKVRNANVLVLSSALRISSLIWFSRMCKFSCPMYKKISGTDFVVDGFMYAKRYSVHALLGQVISIVFINDSHFFCTF